jgi:dual specificity MAP kinase phosphatase
LLHPPDKYPLLSDSPPVYTLTAAELAAALEHIAGQPLPETKEVFPWLHGLHPLNHAQQAFFGARRRSSRKAPKGLRAITIVKAGGDLTSARLRGALAPAELLPQGQNAEPVFLDVDPPDGFSVRNFHIQACKMAAISDIVIYRDGTTTEADVLQLARMFVTAQRVRQAQERPAGRGPPTFNTFVLSGRQSSGISEATPHMLRMAY